MYVFIAKVQCPEGHTSRSQRYIVQHTAQRTETIPFTQCQLMRGVGLVLVILHSRYEWSNICLPRELSKLVLFVLFRSKAKAAFATAEC